MSWLKYNKLAN